MYNCPIPFYQILWCIFCKFECDIYLELIANSTLGNLILSGIAISVFDKGSLFNGPGVLSSAFDKAKLFAENFSKNSNLDESGIS